LHEIALRRPTTLEELASVKGVGEAKLENFGAAVLEQVAEHEGESAIVTA
jgi:ATP-dependent DNA helicase RecQ